MAKKLTILVNEVQRASNALKDFQIEHVVVYNKQSDNASILVLNKDASTAKDVITLAEITIVKMKGFRHFEQYAANNQHYKPQFECKCRGCGKKFNSSVKEAVWCSPKCKSDFRKAKKML